MRTWLDRGLLCLIFALPLGVAAGCSEGTAAEDVGFVCDPGEGQMCTCPNGVNSVSWCRIDGSDFLPCECEAGDEGFGDGDPGDGDPSTGDGDPGDGDPSTGDGDPGDGDPGTGDGDPGDPPLEACYPGPNEDDSVCFPLVSPAQLPDGYDYPAPYQGNANYRMPVAYLDLDAIDQSAQVAPNFSLDEFAQSWKGRYAVVQPHAVAYVQDLRDIVGPIVVNSGFRPPGYNAMIGGVASSRHIYGDGFDLDPVDVPLATLEVACSNNDGFLVEYETHVHCDWRSVAVHVGFFGYASVSTPLDDFPVLGATLERDPDTGVWSAPARGFDEGEPMRRWMALDADGEVLAEARGRSFAPPAAASHVEVLVGARLRIVREL